MRRGDDPHVDVLRLRRADPLERAFLQHAQQLGLQVERQIADLVEEQRAAVRELEASLPRGDRAGERAAGMAEQLAFDQGRRQRRAVDDDERVRAARAARGESPARTAPCRCRSRRAAAPSCRSAPLRAGGRAPSRSAGLRPMMPSNCGTSRSWSNGSVSRSTAAASRRTSCSLSRSARSCRSRRTALATSSATSRIVSTS